MTLNFGDPPTNPYSSVTDTEWDAIKKAYNETQFMGNQTDTFTAAKGWLDTMVNRIGMTRCYGVDSFDSPFTEYNRGVLEVGDTIQTYKTKVITPEIYNAKKTDDVFKLYENAPLAQYNTINVAKTYRTSITQEQIIKAFVSPQTLGDFIGSQMSALTESDTLDQFTEWRKYVSNEKLFKQEVMSASSGEIETEALYNKIRELSILFQQPGTDYNMAGDKVVSSSVDVILAYKDYMKLGAKLGNVYNPEYVALKNTKLKCIRDFGTPTTKNTIHAIVVDSRALNRWIRTPQTWVIQNPVSGVFNYTYKLESIYGVDKFRNAVQIETKA